MANINKSFNFRNGVQVDEDNFLVNALGLVGIGTTIPRAELDVYGTARVSGLVTATSLFVSDVASFNVVSIGTAIAIYGNTGIVSATFYGDGSQLFNIPTSQWVDVDAGFGFTSIYAAGNVGVATTNPSSTFQVGGNPYFEEPGVGINSVGDVRISGVLTSREFVGSGIGITNINASNIVSGTLSNDRLPSIISVGLVSAVNFTSGISTIGFLTASTSYTGFATIGFASISNSYLGVSTVNNLTVSSAIISRLTNTNFTSGIGTITNFNSQSGIITTLTSVNSNIGVATVGFLSVTDVGVTGIATIQNANIISGITTSLTVVNSNIGVATVGFLSATTSYIGIATLLGAKVSNINLAFTDANTVDTSSGDLYLNSSTGLVNITDKFIVAGIATFQSDIVVETTLIPDVDLGAFLGSGSKYFRGAYLNEIQVGVAASNKISTRNNKNIVLDSSGGTTEINDNLLISGITTANNDLYCFGNLYSSTGFLPTSDQGSSLGSSLYRFNGLYVDNVTIGVGGNNKITTSSGDLQLDSASGSIELLSNLSFPPGSSISITGIASIQNAKIDIGSILNSFTPENDLGVNLGSNLKRFSGAYVDNIQVGINGSNLIDTVSGDLIISSSSGLVEADANFTVSGNTILNGNAYLGSSTRPLTIDYANSKIGIGTTNPSENVEIWSPTQSLLAIVSPDGSSFVHLSNGNGFLTDDTAFIGYGSSELTFKNLGVGNISYYIDSGSASGIDTARFAWVNGKTSTEILSLTADGRFGIGQVNPERTFEVVGTSTITSDLYVGGDLYINGSLFGNASIPLVLDDTQINNISGVSTFYNIEVSNNLTVDNIGIGTTSPLASLDVLSGDAIFGAVGVGTTINQDFAASLYVLGTTILDIVSIGTATPYSPEDGSGIALFDGYISAFNSNISISNGLFVGDSESYIAIGKTSINSVDSIVDFSDAGSVGIGTSLRFMLPPIITSAQRTGLSTVAGAIIYNSTTNKHQGYDGTTWNDLY